VWKFKKQSSNLNYSRTRLHDQKNISAKRVCRQFWTVVEFHGVTPASQKNAYQPVGMLLDLKESLIFKKSYKNPQI